MKDWWPGNIHHSSDIRIMAYLGFFLKLSFLFCLPGPCRGGKPDLGSGQGF